MAPTFPMTKAQVLDLVNEVRASLTNITKEEQERLAKAESSTSESSTSESSMSKASVSPSERSRSPEASSSVSADVYKKEHSANCKCPACMKKAEHSVQPKERSSSPEATPGFRKTNVEPAERAKDPKGGDHAAGTSDSPERSGALGKADVPFEDSASRSASSSPSASRSASPSASSEGSASASPEGAPPAGTEGMPPEAGPEGMPPEAGPEGMPPEGAQAGPSYEELVELYMALPPEDLEAHAAAMQQAIAAKQGMGAGGPGPEAPPAAGPSPTPAPGGPAFKSERIDALESELQKTQADLQAVAEAFEKVLTLPQRKAQTNAIEWIRMQPIAKAEKSAKKDFSELTKAELNIALIEMTGPESKLTKAEREVVTKYCVGRAPVSVLESLYNK